MQVVLVTLYIYACYGYGIDITMYMLCENLSPSPPQLAGLILQCQCVSSPPPLTGLILQCQCISCVQR